MKNKLSLAILLHLLAAVVMLHGAEKLHAMTADLTPEQIFQRAREAMDTMSYSAVRYEEGDRTKVKNHTVQYQFPDGVVCRRVEVFGDYGSVALTNRQGEFELFPEQKIAFKRNETEEDKYFDLLSNATFSARDVIFHDHPCYYLTAKTHPSTEQLEKLSQMSRELVPGGIARKQLAQQLQRVEVFYVGKENFFIYRHDVFSNAGKLVASYPWDEVDFEPNVEEKLFELPKDYSVEVTDGLVDFAKREGNVRLERIERAREQRKQSSVRQQPPFWQGFPWLKVTEYLAWAFAVGSIGMLLGMKFWPVIRKTRKRN